MEKHTGSLKFPDPLTLEIAQTYFPDSESIVQDESHPALWHVFDAGNKQLGDLLRTSPVIDNLVGYQGPTDTLIVLNAEGIVQRIAVHESYDNLPYYGYLNQDWGFRGLFSEMTLEEVASFDLEANEVEGVSGATMTSMTVAEGVVKTAKAFVESQQQTTQVATRLISVTARDLGTGAVILFGLILAFTKWRGNLYLRIAYQLLLIIYVGFINGDLLSQAMFVGWAQNGIPWGSAFSLLLMTGVAFTFPVLTKRNVYCSHLCAHGAHSATGQKPHSQANKNVLTHQTGLVANPRLFTDLGNTRRHVESFLFINRHRTIRCLSVPDRRLGYDWCVHSRGHRIILCSDGLLQIRLSHRWTFRVSTQTSTQRPFHLERWIRPWVTQFNSRTLSGRIVNLIVTRCVSEGRSQVEVI